MNKLINLFLFIIEQIVDLITFFYNLIAKLLNYPNNPGMPIIRPDTVITYFNGSSYPRYVRPIGFEGIPTTWLEILISKNKELDKIPKFYYQSSTDGFYSFYINEYSNSYFLPDWLSKWLQLNCNICLDTTNLESIQESVFVFLLLYMNFISFRIVLYWFLSINPFIRPWIYITSLIDWSYDITAGLTPGILGIDVGFVLYISLVGKVTDIVNSLIFTMPFLPSEGEHGMLKSDPNRLYLIPDIEFLNDDKISKPVIFFRYLQKLWYTHPIPNEIREFWFYQRPDIFNYMISNYKQLGINFYPDGITLYPLEEHKIVDISLSSINNFNILSTYDSYIHTVEKFLNSDISFLEIIHNIDN